MDDCCKSEFKDFQGAICEAQDAYLTDFEQVTNNKIYAVFVVAVVFHLLAIDPICPI